MPIYYYKGKKIGGSIVEGKCYAYNQKDVAVLLKKSGYQPISIKAQKRHKSIDFIKKNFFKINSKELSIFCHQFSELIKSGINVTDCLSILNRQAENKILKKTIDSILMNIKTGMTLSEACKHTGVFPEVMVYMLKAGELSGNLDEVLKKLGVYFEQIAKQNEKVKNAMLYPYILVITTLAVTGFLVANVLPVFTDIFKQAGAELPYATRLLLKISFKIKQDFALVIILIVLFSVILNIYLKTPKGAYKKDLIKLKMPIIGPIQQKSISALFCRMLAVLMSSGIPLLESIELISKTLGNVAAEQYVNKVCENIKDGQSLTDSINKNGIFSPVMIAMISVGEESGTLETMLSKAASFNEHEIEVAQERLMTLIEPILLIIIFLIISFIVFSIILPMLDLYNLF